MGAFDEYIGAPSVGAGSFDDYIKVSNAPDLSRGWSTAWKQLPELGYGLAALVSAGVETLTGPGGLATAAKEWSVKGYEDWASKIQSQAKDTDEFTTSYDRAKEGDYGALIDWLQYGIGYTAGQGVQMLATGGIGGLVGKTALKGLVQQYAKGAVGKEAARLATEKLGEKAAAAEIAKIASSELVQKAAVANVASKIGQFGALGAAAYGMEGGEIGGDLVSEATKEGRVLTGSELGRAAFATALAGTLEYVGDVIGYGFLTGGTKILPKGLEAATGLTGRAARAGVQAAPAALAEGGTEFLQTLTEEYGKGKDPFSEDAVKQAWNAAALGAVGGTVYGGVGGALQSPKRPAPEPTPSGEEGPAGLLPAPVYEMGAGTSLEAQQATQGVVDEAQANADRIYQERAAEEQRRQQAFQQVLSPDVPTAQSIDAFIQQSGVDADTFRAQVGLLNRYVEDLPGRAVEAEGPKPATVTELLGRESPVELQEGRTLEGEVLDTPENVAAAEAEKKSLAEAVPTMEGEGGVQVGETSVPTIGGNRVDRISDTGILRIARSAKNDRIREQALAEASRRFAEKSQEDLQALVESTKAQTHVRDFARGELQKRAAVAIGTEVKAFETGVEQAAQGETWQGEGEQLKLLSAPKSEEEAFSRLKNFDLPSYTQEKEAAASRMVRAAAAVARAFGRNVYFVRSQIYEKDGTTPVKGAFEAFVNPQDPSSIYVNLESKRAARNLIYHEVLHTLKRTNPEVYKGLLPAVAKAVNARMAATEYEGQTGYALRYYGQGVPTQIEEMTADVWADALTDWRTMAQVFKLTEKNVVRRWYKTIRAAIDSVISRMTGLKGYDTSAFITDMKSVRGAVARAYAEWQKAPGAVVETQGVAAESVMSKPAQQAIPSPIVDNVRGDEWLATWDDDVEINPVKVIAKTEDEAIAKAIAKARQPEADRFERVLARGVSQPQRISPEYEAITPKAVVYEQPMVERIGNSNEWAVYFGDAFMPKKVSAETESEAIKKASALRPAKVPALSKPATPTSLNPYLYGKEVPKQVTSYREAGEHFRDRAVKAFGRTLDITNPDDQRIVAATLTSEVKEAQKQEGNASQWYAQDIESALAVAGLIHPKIASDPKHRFAFTFALAVTSNGMGIAENVDAAFEVYRRYERNGSMPAYGIGVRAHTMIRSFGEYNRLANLFGEDQLRKYLLEKHEVEWLKRAGYDVRERDGEIVYGGAIFGPKIGGAFLQNLNENYDVPAIDRWLMRTIGRVTGDILSDRVETGLQDDPRSRGMRAGIRAVITEVSKRTGLKQAEVQALLWYPEKDLYRAMGLSSEEPTSYAQEVVKYARGKEGVTREGLEGTLRGVQTRLGRRDAEVETRRGEETRGDVEGEAAQEAVAPLLSKPQQRTPEAFRSEYDALLARVRQEDRAANNLPVMHIATPKNVLTLKHEGRQVLKSDTMGAFFGRIRNDGNELGAVKDETLRHLPELIEHSNRMFVTSPTSNMVHVVLGLQGNNAVVATLAERGSVVEIADVALRDQGYVKKWSKDKLAMRSAPARNFKAWSGGIPMKDVITDASPVDEPTFKTGTPFVARVHHGSPTGLKGDAFDVSRLGVNTGAPSARLGFFASGLNETAWQYTQTGTFSGELNENTLTGDVFWEDGTPELSFERTEPSWWGRRDDIDARWIKDYEPTEQEDRPAIENRISESYQVPGKDNSMDIVELDTLKFSGELHRFWQTLDLQDRTGWIEFIRKRQAEIEYEAKPDLIFSTEVSDDRILESTHNIKGRHATVEFGAWFDRATFNIIRDIDGTYRASMAGDPIGVFKSEEDAISASNSRLLAEYARRNEGKSESLYTLLMRSSNPYVYDYEGNAYREESYYSVISRAKNEGHDAVVLLNTYDGGPLDNIFVFFDPNQVKSPDNIGDYSRSDNNIYRSAPAQPIFYSELSRQLAAKNVNAAPANAWPQILRSLKDVKKDEIEWSGVTDWLATKDGKVTKDDLLAYLNQNGVEVREIVYGDPASGATELGNNAVRYPLRNGAGTITLWPDTRRRYYGDPRRTTVWRWMVNNDPMMSGQEDDRDAALRSAERTAGSQALRGEPPKYGNPDYNLPGGENYRELLLTLPTNEKRNTDRYAELTRIADERDLTDAEQREMVAIERAESGTSGDAEKAFRSGHWEEPNILAHIRFNERTDADGKKVLFIEEIQSDWAQKGREEGFRRGESPRLTALPQGYSVVRVRDVANDPTVNATHREYAESLISRGSAFADGFVVSDGEGGIVGNSLGMSEESSTRDAIRMLNIEIVRENKRKIPPAPFVTDTKSWTALVLKRMIRWAVDHNFDRVAWTTGEQQTKRWEGALRNRVDRIEWTKTADGVHLNGQKENRETRRSTANNLVIDERDDGTFDIIDTELQLPDPISTHASMAEARAELNRLRRSGYTGSTQPGGYYSVVDTTVRESQLSDAIGKVMGDQIRNDPNQTGVIEGKDIVISDTGMAGFYEGIVPQVANKILAKLGGGKVVEVTMPFEGAVATSRADESIASWLQETPASKQPGFDITPEMREKASQPQALFSKPADVVAAWQKFANVEGVFQRKPVAKNVKKMERITKLLAPGTEIRRQPPLNKTYLNHWIIDLEPSEGKPRWAHIIQPRPGQYLYENGEYENRRVVWADLSHMTSGQSRGSLIYDIVANYAHNNGLTFIGDPSGMTNTGAFRRVENMLSTALKFGTTNHIEPHERQTGTTGLMQRTTGFRPLNWIPGDSQNNLRELLLTSYENAKTYAPAIESVVYDFKVNEFRDAEGNVLTNPDFAKMAREANKEFNYRVNQIPTGMEAIYPENYDAVFGVRTLKRAAITNTLLKADGEGALDDAVASIVKMDKAPASVSSVLYSRPPEMPPTWVLPGDEEHARKFNLFKPHHSLRDRFNEMTQNWGLRMKQGLVDQFAPIKEFVGFREYMLARMSSTSDGAVESMFLYGKPFLEDGALNVRIEQDGRGGLANLLSQLEGEHDRWFAWVAANRAERLKAEGKENWFTNEDIRWGLSKLPDGNTDGGQNRKRLYERVYAEFNQYQKAVLDIAQEQGLIDGESRKDWEHYFYVPFYRNIETGRSGFTRSSGLVNQEAFKRLKGGQQELRSDLLENTIINWSHLLSASMRNKAALETLKRAAEIGAATEPPNEYIAKQMMSGKKLPILKANDQGVTRYFLLNDEPGSEGAFLLDAVSSLEGATVAPKILQNFKRWLTIGVTANPSFKIRNLIRDAVQAMAVSDLPYNPVGNVASAWADTAHLSPIRASMLASGGIMRFGTMVEGSRSIYARDLITKAGIDNGTIIDSHGKWKALLKLMVERYNEFGDRGENVQRAKLYKELRDQGKNHLEASFLARDLMDFSMQGTWRAIRFLVQSVPFFNARMQGLYKLGRAGAENPRRMAYVTGATIMASLALLAMYHDDDDWKKRPDWDRETYWWFKVGDKAFRIPKPFEIGAVASLAERMFELAMDDEMTGQRFAGRLRALLSDQLAMNPIPQFVKPMVELYANWDEFRDRPIESQGMENLPKAQRIGRGTSAVAQALGNPWASPVQIDHAIRGYFGWLGTSAVSMLDFGMRPLSGLPSRPAMQLKDALVVGNFVQGLPSGSSRYIDTFYESAKEINESYAAYRNFLKTGQIEKAREYLEANREQLAMHATVGQVSRAFTELNAQEKRVEQSGMSPDEKRTRLDLLDERKAMLAKRYADSVTRRRREATGG